MKVFMEKGMDNGVKMLLRSNGKVQQTLVSLIMVSVGSWRQTPGYIWLGHEQEVTAHSLQLPWKPTLSQSLKLLQMSATNMPRTLHLSINYCYLLSFELISNYYVNAMC